MASKDKDQLEVQRISGVVQSAEERMIADLVRALGTHKDEVRDVQAELALEPLDDATAARMMDAAGCVSGYRKVTLGELCGQSEADLGQWLSSKLTTATLENVEYEAVWAAGQVIVIYVRGSESAAG